MTLPDLPKGVVVYEGGGSLLVLFRNLCECKAANKVFSRIVLEQTYSLVITVAHVEWRESQTFEANRDRLLNELEHKKFVFVPDGEFLSPT